MVPGNAPLMVGRASVDIKVKQLESGSSKDLRSRTLKTFSKFFGVSWYVDKEICILSLQFKFSVPLYSNAASNFIGNVISAY